MEPKIKLGQRVKDKVTGFEGIAVSRILYLNGCVQYNVNPKTDKNGDTRKGLWVDEDQLIIIDNGILTPLKKKFKINTGGGIRNHPFD